MFPINSSCFHCHQWMWTGLSRKVFLQNEFRMSTEWSRRLGRVHMALGNCISKQNVLLVCSCLSPLSKWQCSACDHQLSLHYLLMTALGGEPQMLLLSQVISAAAGEDKTGSYVHKWSRTTRPPGNCYGLRIYVAKQSKERQHQMWCFASSRWMSSRLKGPRDMGRCFHLSLQWQGRLKFQLLTCI